MSNVVPLPLPDPPDREPVVWHQKPSIRVGEITAIVALVFTLLGLMMGMNTRFALLEHDVALIEYNQAQMKIPDNPVTQIGHSAMERFREQSERMSRIEDRLEDNRQWQIRQDAQIDELKIRVARLER